MENIKTANQPPKAMSDTSLQNGIDHISACASSP